MLDIVSLLEGRGATSFKQDEVEDIYNLPLTTLIYLAQAARHRNFNANEVQMSTLLSIKTGGCKEDCGYCPQSAHHSSQVDAHGLLRLETIVEAAKAAKAGGATRFCMGAAWRSPPKKGPQFERVLEAVRAVRDLDLEVCVTLGMLDEDQAKQLQEAGTFAYNHNLDSSRDYYKKIISTRTYDDRLDTIKNVRKAGMTVCCGGIVGMGESKKDRIELLCELSQLEPQPESVPINLLVRVEGTPLSEQKDLDVAELIRTIACATIIMPRSRVRLSAGREQMSDEAQMMCFLAGASSIFTGEKLLTTPNPGVDKDLALLERMGLKPLGASDEVKGGYDYTSQIRQTETSAGLN